MTMEEWLRSQRENAEIFGAAAKERGAEAEKAYYDGMMEAIDALLSNLPEFEHEVTLREFKKFCRTHEQCSRCSVVDMCRFDCPRIWDIEEMERRMKYEEEQREKEARNERRSNSTVKGYTENS